MSAPDFNDWAAQRPPADFADDAVRAMLSTDVAATRKRRPWLGAIGLAALLIGTTAWATLGGHTRPAKAEEPVMVETATAMAVELEPSPERSPQPSVVAPAEPPERDPRSAQRAPAPKVEMSAPTIELEAPTVTRHPRCQCDQDVIVCACLE
jgi:hypothetical protein